MAPHQPPSFSRVARDTAQEEACSRALRGEREFTAARGGSDGGLWEAEKGRDEQEAGEGVGLEGLPDRGRDSSRELHAEVSGAGW